MPLAFSLCPCSSTSTCSACASTLPWTIPTAAPDWWCQRRAPHPPTLHSVAERFKPRKGTTSKPVRQPASLPLSRPTSCPLEHAEPKAAVPAALQVDAVAVPRGPANPAGNAWTTKETDLLCEAGRQRPAAGLRSCARGSTAVQLATEAEAGRRAAPLRFHLALLPFGLPSTAEAQRLCDAGCGRYWKIRNPACTHPATGAS